MRCVIGNNNFVAGDENPEAAYIYRISSPIVTIYYFSLLENQVHKFL